MAMFVLVEVKVIRARFSIKSADTYLKSKQRCARQRSWLKIGNILGNFQSKSLIAMSKNQNFCNFFYSFLHKHLGGLAI